MSTLNELLARAQEVRDEQAVGGNTALRVGQLLTDIIQWCADTDADFVESVEHYVALLNERDGIINWWQSRVILLKTMGSDFDDVDVSTLNDGDLYYDNVGQWLFERENGGSANGHHPSEGVLYVNLATKTAYQWDGASFQVAIKGGGGTSSITAFTNYVVKNSTSELPTTGNANTGYIVGNHIYAYVGEGGDTRDGKYQDLGALEAAGVSVTTAEDGTFTIHAGGNDYTVNLNHTHENMAKLVVCEESGLPSTYDDDTIYAVTDNGEIGKLVIRGMEFAGGGVPDTGEPMISSPSNGSTINLGDNTAGQGVSKTITIKGKNLTGDITVAVGTGLTISYGQSTGQSSVTIPMAQALLGAQVTIAYSGTGALDDGSLVIRQGNDVLSSVVVVVVVVPVPTTLTAIKMTGTQWLQTDYKPNANTEFELDVKFSGFSSSYNSGQVIFDCALNTIANTNKIFRCYWSGTMQSYGGIGIKLANEESVKNPVTNAFQVVTNAAVDGQRGIIKYVKGQATGASGGIQSGGTFSCGSSSVETSLKSSTMENALKIGHGRTANAEADAISDFTEFIIYGFVITENGTTVRNYVPATFNGVPGLHDTVTGEFISSETSTPVVAIE